MSAGVDIHLEQLANVNQLRPGTVQANPGVNPDALRPYKGYSTIIEAENVGGSFYHSLQANLKRRLTNGLLFGIAYTWSKSLDYGSSNGTNIVNAYDNSVMYGPSDFDTRHVLVANYVWDIPYGTHATNGFVRNALGNWQFSGTLQGQSGRPQTVSQNNDRAGVGPGSGNQFWVATKSPALDHQFSGGKSTNQWFEPGAFSPAPVGTFAPARNPGLIYGPGFQSFSAALQKAFKSSQAMKTISCSSGLRLSTTPTIPITIIRTWVRPAGPLEYHWKGKYLPLRTAVPIQPPLRFLGAAPGVSATSCFSPEATRRFKRHRPAHRISPARHGTTFELSLPKL